MKKTVYRFIFILAALAMLAGCEDIASGVKSLTDTYKVQTDESILHGTITVTPENAKAGETVIIMVEPEDGYQLVADSLKVNDGAVPLDGSGNKWTFTMPAADVTVKAEFDGLPAGQYSVTIGSFTNGGIETDKMSAAANETVTLTVTPVENYRLVADSLKVNEGAVTVNGAGNTYTFTMPAANVTVTAEFEELPAGQYSVTIGSLTHGGIETDKTSAAEGETVTLTVTPEAGYQYTGGSLTVTKTGGGTVTLNGSGPYTFTMPASNVTVTATFTAISYTISITDPGNSNSVSADPSDSATVGTPVTLTVTPAAGYQLQSITVTKADSGEVEVNGSNNTRTFTMPASNVTVAATFTAIGNGGTGNDIYINAMTNGTVTPSTTNAAEGTIVTLTVTPNDGYQLQTNSLVVKRSGNEVVPVSAGGAPNTWTFTMPNYFVDVSAAFELIPTVDPHSITQATNVTGGTISFDKTSATAGETITITLTPDNDRYYVADTLTVNKAGGGTVSVTSSGSNWTFEMPGVDVTVTATFAKYNHNITIDSNITGGTVTPSSAASQQGNNVRLYVTPDNGYRLKADTLTVTRNDNQSNVTVSLSVNDWIFTMPAVDVTVTAEFEAIPAYTITLGPFTNGAVSAKVEETPVTGPVAAGAIVTLTVTADANYLLKAGTLTVNNGVVQVNGIGNTYTFNMPEGAVTVAAEFEEEGAGEALDAGLYTVLNNIPDKVLNPPVAGLANALAWIKSNGNNNTHYLIVLDTDETESTTTGYVISSASGASTVGRSSLTITLQGAPQDGNETVTIEKTKNTGPLFSVYGNNSGDVPHLILDKNITLKGRSGTTSSAKALVVVGSSSQKGTFTMLDGSKITGNYNTQSASNSCGGGVNIATGGTFNMQGGVIYGNSARKGAGVFVYGGTFNKTGGTIYGKEATDGNANTPTNEANHVIETSGSNWRDSTAGPTVNTADANFWENN